MQDNIPPTEEQLIELARKESLFSEELHREWLVINDWKTGYMMTCQEFVDRPAGVYTIGIKGCMPTPSNEEHRLEQDVARAADNLERRKLAHLIGKRQTELLNYRLTIAQKRLLQAYIRATDILTRYRNEHFVERQRALHKAVVLKAKAEGRYIPPEVLQEYSL